MKTNGKKKKLKFCGKLLEIKKKFEKGNLIFLFFKKTIIKIETYIKKKKIIYVFKKNNNKSNFGEPVGKINNDDFEIFQLLPFKCTYE